MFVHVGSRLAMVLKWDTSLFIVITETKKLWILYPNKDFSGRTFSRKPEYFHVHFVNVITGSIILMNYTAARVISSPPSPQKNILKNSYQK